MRARHIRSGDKHFARLESERLRDQDKDALQRKKQEKTKKRRAKLRPGEEELIEDVPQVEKMAGEKTGASKPTKVTGTPAALPSTSAVDQDPGLPQPQDVHPKSGMEAFVLATGRSRVRVVFEDALLDLPLVKSLAISQQTSIAVGDRVLLERRPDESLVVVGVYTRRSNLSRPDPDNPHRQRVLAANIDISLIVVTARSPGFKPGLVDRFLVLIRSGGSTPVICVNKIDLLSDTREREDLKKALGPYEKLGIAVVEVSALAGEGIDTLRSHIRGKTCVLVGHSGAGKSSLLNSLDPDEHRKTTEVREKDGRGRHTTTSSSLTELLDGTRVIDTPGVRLVSVAVSKEELDQHFPEIMERASFCRFGDCTHTVEPDCAVQLGVKEGVISQARYESYCRILESS